MTLPQGPVQITVLRLASRDKFTTRSDNIKRECLVSREAKTRTYSRVASIKRISPSHTNCWTLKH